MPTLPAMPVRTAQALRIGACAAGMRVCDRCGAVVARALVLGTIGVSICAAQTVPRELPAPMAPSAQVSAAETGFAVPVHGVVRALYSGRGAGSRDDHDVYANLSLDAGDAKRQPLTAHCNGRAAWDLDGRDRDGTFFHLDDTYDDRVTLRLYDAYVDAPKLLGVGVLRGGRQLLWDTPETLWFDGVHLETRPMTSRKLQLGVYGGATVHLHESSRTGDWAVGTYAQTRPWQGGRVRVDWMHLADERAMVGRDDDLLGLGWWQNVGGHWDAHAQYTRFANRDRDVRVRLGYRDAKGGRQAQATYYQLLATERDLVLELDPFYSALRDYYPFQQFGFSATQTLWQVLDVQAGTDFRHVADSADEGQFNRDYDRYFVSLGITDIPWAGLVLRGTADLWYADGQHVRSWSGELSQRVREKLTLAVGSLYSLYKFDVFLDSERDHVRSYYADVRYRADAATTFSGVLRFEDDDFDDYIELRLGVTWRF